MTPFKDTFIPCAWDRWTYQGTIYRRLADGSIQQSNGKAWVTVHPLPAQA